MVVSTLFVLLLFAVGLRSGVFVMAAQMLSRMFASSRRREVPEPIRGGGLGQLPTGLAQLVVHGRAVEASVAVLRQLAPDYHRTFESGPTGLLDDRRRQALRRDFEDAVVHVARALDGWCVAHDRLDERSRLQLRSASTVPDVRSVLERFAWLPRRVIDCGTLHYRADEPAFEHAVFGVDAELRELEQVLVSRGARAYR